MISEQEKQEELQSKGHENTEIPGSLDEKKDTLHTAFDYLVFFALVIAVCLLFIRFVGIRSVVNGSSMNDTLQDGDNVFVWELGYRFHDPERFDVIIFELKDQPGVHYIKRVIGLPGETVQVIDGYVYINGEKLESDVYGKEVMECAYMAEYPVTLGEDEFFVLGDNRNNSRDSRAYEVGPVNKSQIVGKGLFRFWPIWKLKGL